MKKKNYSTYSVLKIESLGIRKIDHFITIFVILFFLAVTTIAVYSGIKGSISTRDYVKVLLKEAVEGVSSDFSQYLASNLEILHKVAVSEPATSMDLEGQTAAFRDLIDFMSYEDIITADLEGNCYYFKNGLSINQANSSDFKNSLSQKNYITQPYFTEDGGFLSMSTHLTDENGVTNGLLILKLSLNNLQDQISSGASALDAPTLLINKYGDVIAYDHRLNELFDTSDTINLYVNKNNEIDCLKNCFETHEPYFDRITISNQKFITYCIYQEDLECVLFNIIPYSTLHSYYKPIVTTNVSLLVAIFLLFLGVWRINKLWIRSNNLMNTDTLCGCGSRVACYRLLDQLPSMKDNVFAIIYMDLNHFKEVNDTFGHDKGDLILQTFSGVLLNKFGNLGFLGRLGGDEFIAIIPDKTKEELNKIGEQAAIELREASKGLGFDYTIRSSFGIEIYDPKGSESVYDVLKRADNYMYRDKELKHNE